MKKTITIFAALFLACAPSYAQLVSGSDSDGDGVFDFEDNCLIVANADQIDADADGYGNACDTDLNNDGVVNFLDVSILSSVFLTNDPIADANSDGVVNFLDLFIMSNYFLQPPGPVGVVRWVGESGSWDDKTNWLPAEVPNSLHHVVIDAPTDVFVTFTSESFTRISSIELNNKLDVCGYLVISFGIELNGELTLRCSGRLVFDSLTTVIEMDGVIRMKNATIEHVSIYQGPLESGKVLVENGNANTFNNVVLGVDADIQPAAELTIGGNTSLNDMTLKLISDEELPAKLHVASPNGLSGQARIVYQGPSTPFAMGVIDASEDSSDLAIEQGIFIEVAVGAFGLLGDVGDQVSLNISNEASILVNSNATLKLGVDAFSNINFGSIDCFGGSIAPYSTEQGTQSFLVNDASFSSTDCSLSWPASVGGEGSFLVNQGSIVLPFFHDEINYSITNSNIVIDEPLIPQLDVLASIGDFFAKNTIELLRPIDLAGNTLEIDGAAWSFGGNTRDLGHSPGFSNGQLSSTPLTIQSGEILTLESISLISTTVNIMAGAELLILEDFSMMFFSKINMQLTTDCAQPDSGNFAILNFYGDGTFSNMDINGSGSINAIGGDITEGCQKAYIFVDNNLNVQLSNEIDVNVNGGELLIQPSNQGGFDLFGTLSIVGENSRVTNRNHVENYGTISVLEGAEFIVDTSPSLIHQFTNLGQIDSIDSTVRLIQGWRNGGTINIAGGNNNLIALDPFQSLEAAGTINFDNTSVTLDFNLLVNGEPFFRDFTFTNSSIDYIGTLTGFSSLRPIDTSSLPNNFVFANGLDTSFTGGVDIIGSQPLRLGGISSLSDVRLETDLILEPKSNTNIFGDLELVNSNLIVVSQFFSSPNSDSTITLGSSIIGVGTVILDTNSLSATINVNSIHPFSSVIIELGSDIAVQLAGPGRVFFNAGEGEIDIRGPVFADSGNSSLFFQSITRLHDELLLSNRGSVSSFEGLQFVGSNSGLTIEAESDDFGNAIFAFNNSSIDVSDATLSVVSESEFIPDDCEEFDVLNYSPIAFVTKFANFGNLTVGGKLLEIDYSLTDKTILKAPRDACP